MVPRIEIKDLQSQGLLGFFPQKTTFEPLLPRKYTFRENGHRVVPPEKTIQRVKSILMHWSIRFSSRLVRSELGEGLNECFFVHKVSSDCLYDNFGKNYALGKGLTCRQSLASGFCELIERFSALPRPEDKFINLSTKKMEKKGKRILHPQSMGLPKENHIVMKGLDPFNEEVPIDWVAGYHLIHEHPILIPIAYSHLFSRDEGHSPNRLVEDRPNGLAAGNCMEEAIFQGLLEVVERDAQAIFVWNQLPMPEIDLNSLPSEDRPLQKALQTVQRSGIRLILKDITSDTKIPTIYAFGIDDEGKGPAFQWGVGAHLDPGIALSRALTELIQVRVMFMKFMKAFKQNRTRVDSQRLLSDPKEAYRYLGFCYRDSWDRVRYITDAQKKISFKEIPNLSNPDILTEIKCCLKHITEAGIRDVIAVNLTRDGLDFPVVRILIPGMEFIPWADYNGKNPEIRRLVTVPQKLGYRPSVDYAFGGGKESNFLL